MKKKCFFFLLALLPLVAYADAVEINGLYYNLNGNKAEVTRSPYNIFGVVEIPDKVTYESTEYDVTSIGYRAFGGSSITSVTIPNSVTTIGKNAFEHCLQLTSVTIPNSITTIPDYMCWQCSNLTSVTIPNSVTTIGQGAFFESGLTSLTIPSSVTSIEGGAFIVCSNLSSICVDENNPNYDSRDNCNAIIIKNSEVLLTGCKNTVIPNIRGIAGSAFRGCTELTSITIPNTVSSIGDAAFEGCTGLTSITIPNTVSDIGQNTFSGCINLTSVTLPNSLTGIGASTFENCTGLTSITIPEKVTTIIDGAFDGCDNLTSVTVAWASPISIDDNNPFPNRANATLFVPAASKDNYEAANYWKDFKEIQSYVPSYVSYTLSSVGMGTYCSQYDLDFTNVSGIRAYIACGFNPTTGTVFIMRVNEVPANTGILIKGTPGSYSVPVKNTNMYYSNMFKGTLTAITVPATEDGMKNYVLLGSDLLFHGSLGGSTLTANRAYLQIPLSVVGNPANTRGFVTLEENGTTGIVYSETMEERDNGKIYNLNGQQITSPKKGLYIRNGKKVLIH